MRATLLREATASPIAGARVIDATYTVIKPGKRRTWRGKLLAAAVTIACVAIAGLALPPIIVGAYIINDALKR
jgi:hypothetical protein